ncbi:MAG: STN domain-containing protein [Pseudomonadota bacterium]
MDNHQTRNFKKSLLACMASSLAIMAAAPMAVAQDAGAETAAQSFNLPAGPLGDAFFAITTEFDVNIIADERLVQGKTAPAVSGVMSAE